MLESLGASAPVDAFRSRAPATLTYARSCYDHLAGELAVAIYDPLISDGHLDRADGHIRLSESGAALLSGLGIDTNIAAHQQPASRAEAASTGPNAAITSPGQPEPPSWEHSSSKAG